MTGQPFTIERLDAEAALAAVDALAEILIDTVEGGASVGFLLPISRETAMAFWRKVARSVAVGTVILFVARDIDGIQGTVHLQTGLPENQPHRADVAKLQVYRRARRRGIGEALMLAVEAAAIEAGRTLLVLDTASDEAERIYQRLGWQRAGIIPNYALNPDRTFCDTVIYWKALKPPE